MNGMIYDLDNEPVSGVSVYLNNQFVSYSDIDGHFTINKTGNNEKENILFCKKDGYESVSLPVVFEIGPQLVCFKMSSFEQLVSMAEKLISENKLVDAQQILLKAEAIRENQVTVNYLNAIILYKLESYEEALTALKKINLDNVYVDRLYDDITQKLGK